MQILIFLKEGSLDNQPTCTIYSRSEQARSNTNPNIGALNGQGNDARFVNQDDSRYYDGVEDVPHFNYNQK